MSRRMSNSEPNKWAFDGLHCALFLNLIDFEEYIHEPESI